MTGEGIPMLREAFPNAEITYSEGWYMVRLVDDQGRVWRDDFTDKYAEREGWPNMVADLKIFFGQAS